MKDAATSARSSTASRLLRALVAASSCVMCKRPCADAMLWATDGSGLHPVHAECIVNKEKRRG